jgi:hypothetical protein
MNAVDFDEPIPSKLSHAKALADQDHKIAEKAALIAKALSKVIGAATMAAVSNSISAWPDLKSKDYQYQNVGIAPDREAYASPQDRGKSAATRCTSAQSSVWEP